MLCVCRPLPQQSHQFGSSQYLQANDYQEAAAYPGFAQTYHKTTSSLTIPLKAQHTGVLSSVLLNQFRLTLSPATFTNNAGSRWPTRTQPAVNISLCLELMLSHALSSL